MKMEKKMWSTPMATVEQFAANEYVNACWKIGCLIPKNEASGDWWRKGSSHDPWTDGSTYNAHRESAGNCGHVESQYIYDVGNNQFSMQERHVQDGKVEWLNVEFYINADGTAGDLSQVTSSDPYADKSKWSSTITLDQNDDDQYIFWRTEYTSGRNSWEYYHYGLVDFDAVDHTYNHS